MPDDDHVSDFDAILPEDIKWRASDAFGPSIHISILIGRPRTNSPYVVRLKANPGARLMPHVHPEDRICTVIAGTFYLGRGSTFDPERLVAFPPGSVIVIPKNTPHFHCARNGEYILQLTAAGTTCVDYLPEYGQRTDLRRSPRQEAARPQ